MASTIADRESIAQMSVGYKTNADCTLTTVTSGKAAKHAATLIDVSVDGASLLCEQPLQVGTSVHIHLADIAMPELAATVISNDGDFGTGYRLGIRMNQGSWPYQVFVALTTMAIAHPRNTQVPQPPCLKHLGLTLPCTAEDVRVAFQKRVRHVHPDRGGEIEAFVRLRAAYHEALSLLGGKR